MRRVTVLLALVAALAASAASGISATAAPTPGQVVTQFKARTGTTLLLDRRSSYAGHYTALAVPPSISNRGRYGRFTIWVVTSGDDADVTDLLTDPHTGQLGVPGAASIYWEHDSTMDGTGYWLAKKRYGADIVLWWYGTTRKLDDRFTRLHRALLAIAAG
jgi:hypothetical protein